MFEEIISTNELETKLNKKYYDNNAEVVIQRAKKYMDKIKETNSNPTGTKNKDIRWYPVTTNQIFLISGFPKEA